MTFARGIGGPLYGPQVKYGSTDAQRQQLIAQQLLGAGISTRPAEGGIGEVLARIGTAGIGGYLSNQAGETEKKYQTDRTATLARALSAGQGAENLPGPNPDGTAGYNRPADPNAMAAILMGNPSTADLGAQLAIGQMEFSRNRAAKKEDTAEERDFRKEMFGMERQGRMEDMYASQNFQREMAQISQAFQTGQMTAQQAFQAAENAKSREQQMQIANMSRVPSGYQPTEQGMQAIPGGPADPAVMAKQAEIKAQVQPLTEGQANAATYADRMASSNKIIGELEKTGTDLAQKALGSIPVAGNFAVTKEYQMLDQAKRDFINAVLRRESGAVISDQEFANANKQYFPQPGDSPEVIAQKRKNREESLGGIARAAGPRYQTPKEAPKIKFLGFE